MASEVYLTICSLIDLDNWSTKLRFCTRAISICFLFLTNDNCSSPNTHDPSSSQIHKNVHQNLSFEEHAYDLAMIMMMTMMSRVQLCWRLNSVLHLSQLCPKNLSPNFSSLHCNVIFFTLHWIEMLLHCSADVQSISLLCTWLCIALSRTPKAHNG